MGLETKKIPVLFHSSCWFQQKHTLHSKAKLGRVVQTAPQTELNCFAKPQLSTINTVFHEFGVITFLINPKPHSGCKKHKIVLKVSLELDTSEYTWNYTQTRPPAGG